MQEIISMMSLKRQCKHQTERKRKKEIAKEQHTHTHKFTCVLSRNDENGGYFHLNLQNHTQNWR